MEFFREGKTLTYMELTQMLGQMIEKNILSQLDKIDLEKFYVSFFEASYSKLKYYLESKNYKVVNEKQGLLTASQIKVLNSVEIWYEALEKRNAIIQGKVIAGLENFIVNSYYNEMKKLVSILDRKQKEVN